jgi:hypothetical protein
MFQANQKTITMKKKTTTPEKKSIMVVNKGKTSELVIVKAIEKQYKPITDTLQKMVILTNDDATLAGAKLKELEVIRKEAENQMKAILDPIQLAEQRTRDLFAPSFAAIELIKTQTKQSILDFVNAKEDAQDKLKEDFANKKIKKASTFTGKMTELQVDVKNTKIIRKKVAVISELDKIPREYMVPDMKAIEEALKNGKTVKGAKLQTIKSISL